MNKVLDFLKEHKYLMVSLVLVGISITLGVTYSNYIVTSNDHKAAEMYIGELKYSIEIDGESVNNISVPSGETIVDVKVNNQNPVDTYYKLLYLKNSNLTVKYYETTKDTDDVVTTYSKPNDSVTSSNSNTIKLKITNSSTTSQNLGLSVKGGYITNTVDDIAAPSIYSEITLVETPSTNTYFCTTTDTLTRGLKYVNGQYTYAYKQEGKYASSGIAWNDIYNNGWGVQQTDRTSTDSFSGNMCTYINNKPIISMAYMFYQSQTIHIDISNMNTNNVTNMSNMFNGISIQQMDLSSMDTKKVVNMKSMFSHSQTGTLNLKSFNTSKVTNMNNMFSYSYHENINGLEKFDTSKVTDMGSMFLESQTATLDLNNFDTRNVIDMSYMFSKSLATTIKINNFNTSKVINMSAMFLGSNATSINVNSFDTSNVTDMSGMFYESKVTTLDLSNFDTSKVTNISSMFSNSESLTTIYVRNKFNISNVISNSDMFGGCTSLVGGEGTTYNSSNVDTTYAHVDGGTSYPGYFSSKGTFNSDSWKVIAYTFSKENNSRGYEVGDIKVIDLGEYGTHILRIANLSTPSECSSEGFSQTACGFVLEFQDIITTHNMNDTSTSEGGWPETGMRTFLNNDIYNLLPDTLKTYIIDTNVITGKNYSTESYTSTDKIYLLSGEEVWGNRGIYGDTGVYSSRQLDYYKNIGVTIDNRVGTLKKKGTAASEWWLRSDGGNSSDFAIIGQDEIPYSITADNSSVGVSPAFRIGIPN